jgi:hypothetical protein
MTEANLIRRRRHRPLAGLCSARGTFRAATADALGRQWTKRVGGTLIETYGYAGASASIVRIDLTSSSVSGAIDGLGNRVATLGFRERVLREGHRRVERATDDRWHHSLLERWSPYSPGEAMNRVAHRHREVLLAVQQALLGEVTAKTRAVLLAYDATTVDVEFLCDDIAEEEQEAASLVETELVADFPADHRVTVHLSRRPAPLPIPKDRIWVFYRKESLADT